MAAEAVFNEMIHAPLRLRICGLLRSVDRVDFAVLRDTLDVSDPRLSKHLKVLSGADLVQVKKRASPLRTDSRRITWLSLTAAGRRAFDAHLQALHDIGAGLVQPLADPAQRRSGDVPPEMHDLNPGSAG